MTAYRNFVRRHFGFLQSGEDPAYGYASLPLVANKQIAVMGFNSAWLSARNRLSDNQIYDRSFLILGESQISKPLEKSEAAHIRIAVLHHPFDWLSDFESHWIEERLTSKCHFILVGHQHIPQCRIIQSTIGDCVIIPAGACYCRDAILPYPYVGSYTNSYNFVHLDLNQQRGTIYFRRWSPRQKHWIEDTDSCPNGKKEFVLPKELGSVPLHAEQRVEMNKFEIWEWKIVHEHLHTLVDNLQTVINGLNCCQHQQATRDYKDNLDQVEGDWLNCVSKFEDIEAIFRFNYIKDRREIKKVLAQCRRTNQIKKQIAKARKNDISAIRLTIMEVKGILESTFRVADFRIREMAEEIARPPFDRHG